MAFRRFTAALILALSACYNPGSDDSDALGDADTDTDTDDEPDTDDQPIAETDSEADTETDTDGGTDGGGDGSSSTGIGTGAGGGGCVDYCWTFHQCDADVTQADFDDCLTECDDALTYSESLGSTCLDATNEMLDCFGAMSCTEYQAWLDGEPAPIPCEAEELAYADACA